MKKIYLIRHGESLDDIEDRFGGYANYPLTKKGQTQAKELAKKLSAANIEKIYTSPYLRAWETANVLAGKLSVPLEIAQDIRERNTYGFLSGMRKEEGKKLFAEDVAKTKDPYRADEIDGSELVVDVKKRAESFLSRVKSNELNTIAAVTHSKFLGILLGEVIRLDGKFKFKDCGFLVLNLENGIKVLKHNNVDQN